VTWKRVVPLSSLVPENAKGVYTVGFLNSWPELWPHCCVLSTWGAESGEKKIQDVKEGSCGIRWTRNPPGSYTRCVSFKNEVTLLTFN
jgi:hypothetical protein